jgi:hypothetical protein
MSSAAAAPHSKTAVPEAKPTKEEKKLEFILGNVVFVLFHEVGHALVSEFSCLSSGARKTPSTGLPPSC